MIILKRKNYMKTTSNFKFTLQITALIRTVIVNISIKVHRKNGICHVNYVIL